MLLPRGLPHAGAAFGAAPSLLATWGPGGRSELHAHHAVQLILALDGELRVSDGAASPGAAEAALIASDAAHAVDATGRSVLILFVDPESDAGEALSRTIPSSLRLLDTICVAHLRARLPSPLESGAVWPVLPEVLRELGVQAPARKRVHPAVRRALEASAHWGKRRDDLIRMVPPSIPAPARWVTLTGVLEIAGAIGLLIEALVRIAAIGLFLLLVAVFPANVHAARRGLTIGGRPVTPLPRRAALQLVFLAATAAIALHG